MAQRQFADGTRIMKVRSRSDGKLDVRVKREGDAEARWLVLSEEQYQRRGPSLTFQGESSVKPKQPRKRRPRS